LTGLPDRRVFVEDLSREIVAARTPCLAFVVKFVDLDDFKLVNDRCGHDRATPCSGKRHDSLSSAYARAT